MHSGSNIFNSDRNRQKGFSVVEALVALMLTVIMVFFIFTMFPNTQKALVLSENHVSAANVARGLLMDARKAGFNSVAASTGERKITGINNGMPYNRIFSYSVNVQSVNASKKLVWVNITWSEGGKSKKVVMETIMVKR
jgi:Tfp pilus assembly protein PilW